MISRSLAVIYNAGQRDMWNGDLIGRESDKLHATARTAIASIATILTSPNATAEDRAWAKMKLEKLLD